MSAQSLGTEVHLSHQCKTENGIERDETFKLIEFIGYFEQVVVENQYGMEYIINPNQLVHPSNL